MRAPRGRRPPLAPAPPPPRPAPPPTPTPQTSNRQVKAKLDALYTTGGGPIRPGDLDDRCIERLREIPVATALSVLEVFGHKK